MARGPVVGVVGERELRKTMKKAGENLDELKAAHGEAAQIGATRAKITVPIRTGALASSIRSAGTNATGYIRAGSARVPYANPIHWGWEARNIDPNPFASEAAEETKPRWEPIYLNAIRRILARIKGA